MRKNYGPTRVGIKSCYLPYQSSILALRSPKLGKVLAPIGALRSFQKLRGQPKLRVKPKLQAKHYTTSYKLRATS